MVTDTDHSMATTLEPEGVLTRAALQVRQFVCGLHGHDSLMHFERGRMSLLCVTCGHETPGWEVRRAPAHRDGEAAAPVSLSALPERRAA